MTDVKQGTAAGDRLKTRTVELQVLQIVGGNVASGSNQSIPPGKGPLERLAARCIGKLIQAGHVASSVFLRGKELLYCDHCEVCDREERCAKRDDFWPVYGQMKDAEVKVFFTTVTFAMMNQKLAVLLQRSGRIARHHGQRFSGKRSGLFLEEFTWGGNLVHQQLAFWLEVMGMRPLAVTLVPVGRRADGRHFSAEDMEAVRLEKVLELPQMIIRG